MDGPLIRRIRRRLASTSMQASAARAEGEGGIDPPMVMVGRCDGACLAYPDQQITCKLQLPELKLPSKPVEGSLNPPSLGLRGYRDERLIRYEAIHQTATLPGHRILSTPKRSPTRHFLLPIRSLVTGLSARWRQRPGGRRDILPAT
jgi:hypothetical protein